MHCDAVTQSAAAVAKFDPYLTMQVWEHDGGDWQHFMAAPPYTRVLLDLHRCSVGCSCLSAHVCEGVHRQMATLLTSRATLVNDMTPTTPLQA